MSQPNDIDNSNSTASPAGQIQMPPPSPTSDLSGIFSLADVASSQTPIEIDSAAPMSPADSTQLYEKLKAGSKVKHFQTSHQLLTKSSSLDEMETYSELRTGGQVDEAVPFVVFRQPKTKQRKSYANENRYIAPNPITLQYIGQNNIMRIAAQNGTLQAPTGDAGIAGTVSVVLADKDGIALPPLEAAALVGEKSSRISKEGKAEFSLKMMGTNEGRPVRLLFQIEWHHRTESQRQHCIVISDPFRVDTNVRRRASADRRRRAARGRGGASTMRNMRTKSSSGLNQRAATLGRRRPISSISGDTEDGLRQTRSYGAGDSASSEHSDIGTLARVSSNEYIVDDATSATMSTSTGPTAMEED